MMTTWLVLLGAVFLFFVAMGARASEAKQLKLVRIRVVHDSMLAFNSAARGCNALFRLAVDAIELFLLMLSLGVDCLYWAASDKRRPRHRVLRPMINESNVQPMPVTPRTLNQMEDERPTLVVRRLQ
jgi:hypothetical protein